MTEVTLKPCPFCGGKADRFTIEEPGDNFGGDVISCTSCGASSHVEFGRKENLASRWNTRPASTEPADALVEDLMSAPYEWHGPFGKEKHRIIPPTLFDRILAALTRTDALAEAREALILARRTLAFQPHPITSSMREDKQFALGKIHAALSRLNAQGEVK